MRLFLHEPVTRINQDDGGSDENAKSGPVGTSFTPPERGYQHPHGLNETGNQHGDRQRGDPRVVDDQHQPLGVVVGDESIDLQAGEGKELSERDEQSIG